MYRDPLTGVQTFRKDSETRERRQKTRNRTAFAQKNNQGPKHNRKEKIELVRLLTVNSNTALQSKKVNLKKQKQ